MQQTKSFHEVLMERMDQYAHFVYHATRTFPKEEIYGITSQLRRSSLSVVLNYVEGYARQSKNTYKHFLDISYASLQESKYLINFSIKEGFLSSDDYEKSSELANKIGAMLWGILSKM